MKPEPMDVAFPIVQSLTFYDGRVQTKALYSPIDVSEHALMFDPKLHAQEEFEDKLGNQLEVVFPPVSDVLVLPTIRKVLND